ncbi:hypothetical protein MSAN_00810900 [Mycena sanguinolenta]|uniref:Uncharacterized protein n=1 Tax=Mycena sanguinolenta TaxID=230812 RepID=A0A8H7DAN3_9AGAR|nr:hypothetical protein MSAN_00810900 [Mycena sanguinolenta]
MAQTAGYIGTPREVYTPRYRRSLRRKVCRLKNYSGYLANELQSIAGIITARICADHFERVIIIDPEIEDPEKPKTRILQYNAAHGELPVNCSARRLWPTFDAEIIEAGGRFNIADLQTYYSGIPLLNPYHDYPPGQFPRTLNMRRSLAQKGSPRNRRQGIYRVGYNCTGTTQAGLKWLKSAGFNVPQDIRSSYHANISYVTVCFTVPPELGVRLPIPAALLHTAAVYAYFPHDDAQSSIVALTNVDNNMMHLIFMDTYGHELPRTEPEVLPFITGVRGSKKPIPSWFIEVVELLCEHGNPSFDTIKIPPQSFVRYHSLATGDLPSNFIAMGDASLQLNPIHGQGFSKALMNGMALNSLLHVVTSNSGVTCLPRDFSSRYFKNSRHTMNSLWDATRLHDYGSLHCMPIDGETKDIGRIARWFERKLISAASKDEEVASALWHVRHLFVSERVFLAPTVLWKVLSTRSLF